MVGETQLLQQADTHDCRNAQSALSVNKQLCFTNTTIPPLTSNNCGSDSYKEAASWEMEDDNVLKQARKTTRAEEETTSTTSWSIQEDTW